MNTYKLVKEQRCQIGKLVDIYMEHIGFKTNGRFVEVGAFNGWAWSNTYCLAEVGWKGLAIEPQPDRCEQFRKNYKNFDVILEQCCVSDFEGKTTLYVGSSLSTMDEETYQEYMKNEKSKGHFRSGKTIECSVYKLDTILDKHKWQPGFEVMSIDVEGAELGVLGGFDIKRWQPQLVIIEAREKHKNKKFRARGKEINKYFIDNDYDKILATNSNSIYILKK